ncbi:MAG: metallophosphoesterase [Candidatus Hydrogenedentes bacterium]|nr:metallophosphoesterase [Candidatus Hydrogenedentota bacterium]
MFTTTIALILQSIIMFQLDYYSEKIQEKECYRILLCADPQIGPADSPVEFEKELELMLRKFVSTVNEEKPDFVVFNGDLVAFPQESYFNAFENAVKYITVPIVLVHGNHDGKAKDGLFWKLQQQLCGFRAYDYAFDCGKWRIILLCAPELFTDSYTFENQIEWLNNELQQAWRKPVIVFLHYHLLPVGLSQLEYYTYPREQKLRLLDTLVRYGNVKYVFMGHVHNGIKASVKTAWEYQGTKFIVLPTLVPGRAFAEEYPEFVSYSDRGFFAELILKGSASEIYGRQIDNPTKYKYPEEFPIFTIDIDSRAFRHWYDMPKSETIQNGDFENGTLNWFSSYRYKSDEKPGFICEVLPSPKFNSNSLHLFVTYKGRSWQYDESLDLYKVISIPSNSSLPTIKLQYYIPNEEKSFYGGGYIRVALFNDKSLEAMWLGHWGAREERIKHLHRIWNYLDEPKEKLQWYEKAIQQGSFISMKLPDYGYKVHSLVLNTDQIFTLKDNTAKPVANLLVVQFGVWCGNEEGSFSGAWFDNFSTEHTSSNPSSIDNLPLSPKMFESFLPYGVWYKYGFDK